MSSTYYSTYHGSSGGGPSPVLGRFLALLNATPLRFSSNHFFSTLSTVRGTVPVAFKAVVMFPYTLAFFWFLTVLECFDCRRVLFCVNCDTSDSTLKSLCAAMPFTASVFSSMLVQYSHRHCRSWDCHMRRTWAGRHFVKCEKLMGVVIASLSLTFSYRSLWVWSGLQLLSRSSWRPTFEANLFSDKA